MVPGTASRPARLAPGAAPETAAAVTSIRLMKGKSVAARMSASKAWAALQGMTRISAPARCSPRAISANTGPGEGPVPAIPALRSGTVGLLSMIRRMWSWSRCAGVALSTRAKKSSVATGPMPPSTPMTLRGLTPTAAPADRRRARASRRCGRRAHVRSWRRRRVRPGPAALRRSCRCRPGRAAVADPVIQRDHALAGGGLDAEELRRLDRQLVDIALLLGAGAAHVDAGERQTGVIALQAHQQARVGAGAARGFVLVVVLLVLVVG